MTIPDLVASTAGHWVFSGRRWLDPEDPEDRSRLQARYLDLCAKFPTIDPTCDADRLLAVLSSFQRSWARRVAACDSCGRRDSAVDSADTFPAGESLTDGHLPFVPPDQALPCPNPDPDQRVGAPPPPPPWQGWP